MGISNEMAAAGYTQPYQGVPMVFEPVEVGTLVDDITITPEGGLPVSIAGADFTDTDTNYAAKVAAFLAMQRPVLSVQLMQLQLSWADDPFLTGFVDGADSYTPQHQLRHHQP